MAVRQAFTADPFELALCEYLNLAPSEVVAGSFETPIPDLVTWQHVCDQGTVRLRSVKMEPGVLDHIRTRVLEMLCTTSQPFRVETDAEVTAVCECPAGHRGVHQMNVDGFTLSWSHS